MEIRGTPAIIHDTLILGLYCLLVKQLPITESDSLSKP